MTRSEKETCGYCQFYAGGEAEGSFAGDKSNGACRRYAPRGVWPTRLMDGTERQMGGVDKHLRIWADAVRGRYMWPMVHEDDWCGEF
jgi:hypothetical protein